MPAGWSAPTLELERFLADIAALGDRLGPLLVQLPASFAFAPRVVDTFFAVLRRRFAGSVVCEPRHADWFGPAAERIYQRYRIGRVGADPARRERRRAAGRLARRRATCAASPISAGTARRSSIARAIRPIAWPRWAVAAEAWSERCDCWCVFDNTASGAAAANALDMAALLAG